MQVTVNKGKRINPNALEIPQPRLWAALSDAALFARNEKSTFVVVPHVAQRRIWVAYKKGSWKFNERQIQATNLECFIVTPSGRVNAGHVVIKSAYTPALKRQLIGA